MLASVGPPGSTAVMNSPDAEPGFRALNPRDCEWPNEAAARGRAARGRRTARSARPPTCAARSSSRVADDDVITPPDLAVKASALAPRSEVRHYPGGHFDPYVGELFERVVADEAGFLLRHLAATSEAGTVVEGAGGAVSPR